MVNSAAWTGRDDNTSLEIVQHNNSIQFRCIEKDIMADITLLKEDVEDLIYELRLWLGDNI